MSKLFDDASLAMIPSAYKDGKLYSIRPTDGSGDFTFSRGSNLAATRVDVNGLIEKGRENRLLQSNQFDTTWVNASSSETGGQSGYDGSSNAWKIDITGAGGRIYQSVSQSGVSTYSIYAKAGSLNWIILSSNIVDASFDLSNGVKGTLVGGISSSIESVGGGWYRCSASLNGSLTQVRVYPSNADNDFTSTSGNIYIQDAQLEAGLVATDYIETGASTAQAGILEDMPRLDYSGGASCPALLLEPQRTNLVEHSEYMGIWAQSDANVTLSDNLSPEGLKNCYRVEGTASGLRVGIATLAAVIGQTYTGSIWIRKVSGSDTAQLVDIDFGQTQIDITTEWQRYNVTRTATSTIGRLYVYVEQIGDVIEVYGAQLEAGSYPTSYIPTYGSSVTRSEEDYVDAINFESGGILGSSSPYTLFFDLSAEPTLSPADGNSQILRLYSGQSLSATMWSLRKYYDEADGKIRFYSNLDEATGTYITSANKKFAMVVDGTDVRFFSDGAKQYTYGATNNHNGVGSMRLSSGSSERTSANFSQVLIFPTALSDAEAIALTE